MESKDEIRKRVLKLRTGLSAEEIRSKSTAIFERIYALRQYKEAATVLAYMDYKNEVMTGEFIRRCQHDGKRVALPKVVVEGDTRDLAGSGKVSVGFEHALAVPDQTPALSIANKAPALSVANKAPALSVTDKAPEKFERSLSVYVINDLDKDTLPGYKGIVEPDSTALKLLDPSEIDLAVIPGVAFDYRRNRIGYGAGYYDRFLHKLRADCLKVSAAFGLQLVDMIPAGRYDVPVDMVVTEELLIE